MALSDRQRMQVAALLERLPEPMLSEMEGALLKAAADPLMDAIRRLVESEFTDRRLRKTVFAPIQPLFTEGPGGLLDIGLPPVALERVWRGLKANAPRDIERALEAAEHGVQDQPFKVHDELALIAAAALREASGPDFVRASEACEAARKGGAQMLAAALELAPLLRRSEPQLHQWTAHGLNEERAVAVRLAYRDACAVADDAGPLFVEILARHLSEPAAILRFVSAVMHRPTQAFLASTELAPFAEGAVRLVSETLERIAGKNPDDPGQGKALAAEVAHATALMDLLAETIQLSRDQGLGRRIQELHGRLARLVEGRFRDALKALPAALPTRMARTERRTGETPVIEPPGPDPAREQRLLGHLTFVSELRSCAARAGVAAARNELLGDLAAAHDDYVDRLIDMLRHHEIDEPLVGARYLDVAAAVAGLIRDPQAADLVRRRAAAARA